MSGGDARGWPAAGAAPAARRSSGGGETEAAAGPSVRDLTLAGLAAARANPALIAVRWVLELVVTALVVAGTAAPALALFGAGFADRFAPLAACFRARDADALAVAVLDLAAEVAAEPGRVAAGLAGLVALWLVAMFLYCWLQGGFYGVLAAADRGGGAAAFSARRFAACGRRLLWPYVWLVNLYATLVLLVALVVLLPPALLPAPPPGELPVAALVSVVALLPPAALAVAALALWYALGRAELARGRSGVKAAARRAVAVLRRRPVPVLAVSAFAAAAALALWGLATPLALALPALGVPLSAAQWLAGTAVATFHAGALVRLMGAEFPWPVGEPTREGPAGPPAGEGAA